jgi:glycosyltransferase involved in cell wall biosynthesis
MKYSIVIPAHNGERYLRSAIQSALKQSRPADEIIVADDASNDGTAAIARWFGDRIQYFYNPQSTGFVDAWNRAVTLASGDFVTILHQDDLLHPDYLDHMENAVLRYPGIRHLYAACDYIDAQGKVTKMPPSPFSPEPVLYSGREYAHNYLHGIITNRHIHRCPGVTTARELLLRECTYRKEAGHIADDDFFLRVGSYTDVVGISQPLASYREHPGSSTSKTELMSLRLAQDYVFQVRYHKEHDTLLHDEDKTHVNRMAVKFINLLLFQSLLNDRKDGMDKALNLRKELDSLLPLFMEKNLPPWAKVLWEMTRTGRNNLKASFYVKTLNRGIQARNFIRSSYRSR